LTAKVVTFYVSLQLANGKEDGGTVGIDRTIVASLKQFLLDFGALPGVEIASAARAATQWEHQLTAHDLFQLYSSSKSLKRIANGAASRGR